MTSYTNEWSDTWLGKGGIGGKVPSDTGQCRKTSQQRRPSHVYKSNSVDYCGDHIQATGLVVNTINCRPIL